MEGGVHGELEESKIGLEEVLCSGYMVGKGIMKTQLNNVETIQKWTCLLTKYLVCSFLDIVGY